MAFYAQDLHDTEADTTTLLQRSSTSSSAFRKVIDSEDDNCNTCSHRACCRFQERQLATPTRFSGLGGSSYCVEWMQDFEEVAQANNWGSRARLDIIPVYFATKSTKTWFRENRHEWNDFDSFKQAFVARFREDSAGQAANAEVRKERKQNHQAFCLFLALAALAMVLIIYFAIKARLHVSVIVAYPAAVVTFQVVRLDPTLELEGLQRVSINIDDDNFHTSSRSHISSSSTDSNYENCFDKVGNRSFTAR
ncbi:hypothetical protein BGZ83_007791 [Gryganskiella cystojenkinii]|nr:hypothetical protein BGZ83_007791 [Gryganskiella cystojenkinii]